MPYANVTELDKEIVDVLNAAASWGGAITALIRHADEIANARQQAALEVLRAISTNSNHGYYGDLSALVTVAHDAFLPAHDGEIGTPRIVPFPGATARDGIPADPDEIDSYRLNPESYTGALTGIPVPHDEPVTDAEGGLIATTTLATGGAGYAVGDTGIVLTGDDTATYQVLTVDGGGAVLTYSITAPGAAYVVEDGIATTPGGAQAGAGAGFTLNITAVAFAPTSRPSSISCRFSIVAARFKFTGYSAQVPMVIITDTMRDTKIPLSVGPAVVKRAIPKLVKPGDALSLIAGEYARDGKQDLVEIAGGAIAVRGVRTIPEIVGAIKQN